MKKVAPSMSNEHPRAKQLTKKQRLGLSVLYPPHGSNIVPLLDIILVHGLNGHYVDTWSASDGTVWPVDLLPKQLPDVRVMTFGYRGTYNDTTSVATTNDHGLSLLRLLMDSRDTVHEAMRPIIFVGHSLGGIIIKQALLNAKKHSDSVRRAHELLQSTYGAIFFSTPHNGIKAKDWEKFVRGVVENTKPYQSRHVSISSEMANAIRHNSNELVQISQDFRFLKNISYVSFWEEFITPKLGKVLVTKDSATMNVVHEDIRKISRHHFDMCRFSKEDDGDFQQVLNAIKKIQQDSPKAKDLDDLGREVLNSLGIDELRVNPLAVEHTKDTCGWITEKPDFQRWKDSSSSKDNKLWILGELGCGKTYLAKHIVNVELQHERIVAQCFMQEISGIHSTGHTILLILLHEVLELCPQLIKKHMVEVYDKRRARKEIWDSETLSWLWPKVILDMVTSNSLTLIIDGLDQCEDDATAFFECFQKCENSVTEHGFLKLLVVSRECPAFSDHFLKMGFMVYKITEPDTREDIKKTVRHSLESTALRRRYKPHLRNLMYEKIPKGADGMYLWARIMTDEVKLACLSEGMLESKLNDLPKGIIELYDGVLGRIAQDKEQRDLIRIVLFWTVFRHEVLRTEELRIGMAMSTLTAIHNNMDISEEGIKKFSPECSIQMTIALLCGHLVKFSANKVNLVHGSLRKFLVTSTGDLRQKYPKIEHHGQFHFREPDSHKVIGDFCVAYLLLRSFEDSGKPFDSKFPGPLEWDKKIHQRLRQYGFVGYAALNWIAHYLVSKETFSINNNRDPSQHVLLNLQNQQAISWTEVWWYLRNRRFKLHNYPMNNLRLDDYFGTEDQLVNHSNSSSDDSQQTRVRQRIAPPPPRQDTPEPTHFLPNIETQKVGTVNPLLGKGISEQYIPNPPRLSESSGRPTGSSPQSGRSASIQAYSKGNEAITPPINSHQPQIVQEEHHAQSKKNRVSTSHRPQPVAVTAETVSGPPNQDSYSRDAADILGSRWNRESGTFTSSQSSFLGDESLVDRESLRTQDDQQNDPDNTPYKRAGEIITLPNIDEGDEVAPVESASRKITMEVNPLSASHTFSASIGQNIEPKSIRRGTINRDPFQISANFETAPEFPVTPSRVPIHQPQSQGLGNQSPIQRLGPSTSNGSDTVDKQRHMKAPVIRISQRENATRSVTEKTREPTKGVTLGPKSSQKVKKQPLVKAPSINPGRKDRPITTTPNPTPLHERIKRDRSNHSRPKNSLDSSIAKPISIKTNQPNSSNTNTFNRVKSKTTRKVDSPVSSITPMTAESDQKTENLSESTSVPLLTTSSPNLSQHGMRVPQNNSFFPSISEKAIPTSRNAFNEVQLEPIWTARNTGPTTSPEAHDLYPTSTTIMKTSNEPQLPKMQYDNDQASDKRQQIDFLETERSPEARLSEEIVNKASLPDSNRTTETLSLNIDRPTATVETNSEDSHVRQEIIDELIHPPQISNPIRAEGHVCADDQSPQSSVVNTSLDEGQVNLKINDNKLGSSMQTGTLSLQRGRRTNSVSLSTNNIEEIGKLDPTRTADSPRDSNETRKTATSPVSGRKADVGDDSLQYRQHDSACTPYIEQGKHTRQGSITDDANSESPMPTRKTMDGIPPDRNLPSSSACKSSDVDDNRLGSPALKASESGAGRLYLEIQRNTSPSETISTPDKDTQPPSTQSHERYPHSASNSSLDTFSESSTVSSNETTATNETTIVSHIMRNKSAKYHQSVESCSTEGYSTNSSSSFLAQEIDNHNFPVQSSTASNATASSTKITNARKNYPETPTQEFPATSSTSAETLPSATYMASKEPRPSHIPKPIQGLEKGSKSNIKDTEIEDEKRQSSCWDCLGYIGFGLKKRPRARKRE